MGVEDKIIHWEEGAKEKGGKGAGMVILMNTDFTNDKAGSVVDVVGISQEIKSLQNEKESSGKELWVAGTRKGLHSLMVLSSKLEGLRAQRGRKESIYPISRF